MSQVLWPVISAVGLRTRPFRGSCFRLWKVPRWGLATSRWLDQKRAMKFFRKLDPRGISKKIKKQHVPPPKKKLDDGWPESEKGKDVDVKYIEERRRCEKISEERMNI